MTTDLHTETTVIDHPGTPNCPACKTGNPTVADVRRALVAESEEFGTRRLPYSRALRGSFDATQADFDAYEALCAAGSFAFVLAAILRKLAEDHGEAYAAQFAAVVHSAMADGPDGIDECANDDLGAARTTPTRTGNLPAAFDEGVSAFRGAGDCESCHGTGLNIGQPGNCPACGGTGGSR
ncbi:MAG TPA: hypothetical protein VIN75_26090 [Burkholderiaceae bacterium]